MATKTGTNFEGSVLLKHLRDGVERLPLAEIFGTFTSDGATFNPDGTWTSDVGSFARGGTLCVHLPAFDQERRVYVEQDGTWREDHSRF